MYVGNKNLNSLDCSHNYFQYAYVSGRQFKFPDQFTGKTCKFYSQDSKQKDIISSAAGQLRVSFPLHLLSSICHHFCCRHDEAEWVMEPF